MKKLPKVYNYRSTKHSFIMPMYSYKKYNAKCY